MVYISRLRLQSQRHVAWQVFEQVFGKKKQLDVSTHRGFCISGDLVTIGGCKLKRAKCSQGSLAGCLSPTHSSHPSSHHLQLLTHNRRSLAVLTQCVRMNWLSILVGYCDLVLGVLSKKVKLKSLFFFCRNNFYSLFFIFLFFQSFSRLPCCFINYIYYYLLVLFLLLL